MTGNDRHPNQSPVHTSHMTSPKPELCHCTDPGRGSDHLWQVLQPLQEVGHTLGLRYSLQSLLVQQQHTQIGTAVLAMPVTSAHLTEIKVWGRASRAQTSRSQTHNAARATKHAIAYLYRLSATDQSSTRPTLSGNASPICCRYIGGKALGLQKLVGKAERHGVYQRRAALVCAFSFLRTRSSDPAILRCTGAHACSERCRRVRRRLCNRTQ